ncbi:MAG: HEAT repeat domain-containing protein [Candidatus Hydrogenedentales bacterium]|jgi:hypothetical protein
MKTHRASLIAAALCLGLALSANADSFYFKPHLQNVSPDGATIIWQTQEKGPADVEFGLEGTFDSKATGTTDQLIRKVRMTGLKPDTSYSYRVRAGEEEYVNSFKTSPGANNDRDVTFIIFGDTRRWDERVKETSFNTEILRWNPEFFIINGDLVRNGHEYEQWPEHFKRFDSLNGKYMIATARGNHEGSMLNDTENDWFGKYHEMPGGSEPYAAFDWGNVHVVLLSWEQTMLNHVKDTAQWLDQQLGGAKAKYTFVTQHFPVYCTGYEGPVDSRKEPGESMVYIRRILDKHNVTAHMSGHTHIYERHYPLREDKRDDRNGVHYLVNGGDIGGNYADWWTAVSDDKATMAKPTYTVYQCKKDRMDIQTFCWSQQQNAFMQIDHDIVWKDEAIPAATLASLANKKGEELTAAMGELAAMLYAPAAQALVPYLRDADAGVRQGAAKALALLGNEAVASDLAAYLSDSDPVVRRYVARSLEAAMPESLALPVAKQASDNAQDPATRVKLIGALQFHAPAAVTRDTATKIIKSDAPEDVRRRAAYALTRVVSKEDIKPLIRMFEDEKDQYVTVRLAFTLCKLTGVVLDLSDKGALGQSEPGKRQEFVQQWLGKKAA